MLVLKDGMVGNKSLLASTAVLGSAIAQTPSVVPGDPAATPTTPATPVTKPDAGARRGDPGRHEAHRGERGSPERFERRMEHRIARMVEKVEKVCGELAGKRVAVLGLAFKPETDDIRDSSSLKLIEDLVARGASVAAYDPAAMENTKAVLPGIDYAEDVYACAAGADALVLATDWNQFRKLDLARLEATMKAKRFVDLRNLYEPREMKRLGWDYVAIGRA